MLCSTNNEYIRYNISLTTSNMEMKSEQRPLLGNIPVMIKSKRGNNNTFFKMIQKHHCIYIIISYVSLK